MDLLKKFNEEQMQKHTKDMATNFLPGDTIKVYMKISEGVSDRVQIFEGLCIKRRHKKGLHCTFTVRKISNSVGVEILFHLYSPLVVNIEIVKRGRVRRAKLYYIRDRIGKAARIKERTSYVKKIRAGNK